ncbi:MAG TPA: hypothetical protein EYQ57_07170 [Methylococcaceae bacterium]|nr:hypothetical protein [Methylococcaceae bacterium]
MSTLAFNMGPAVPIYQEHAHGPATTAIPELKTVFYDAFDQLVHVCCTQLDIELGRQPGQKRHPLLPAHRIYNEKDENQQQDQALQLKQWLALNIGINHYWGQLIGKIKSQRLFYSLLLMLKAISAQALVEYFKNNKVFIVSYNT